MLTEGFDGVLLGVFVLTGFPTGHQGCDGERVGPGRELRFRGRRVLHIGGGGEPDQNIPLKINEPPEIPQKLLLMFLQQRENQQVCPARPVSNRTLGKFDRAHVGPDRPQRLLRVLRFEL